MTLALLWAWIWFVGQGFLTTYVLFMPIAGWVMAQHVYGHETDRPKFCQWILMIILAMIFWPLIVIGLVDDSLRLNQLNYIKRG